MGCSEQQLCLRWVEVLLLGLLVRHKTLEELEGEKAISHRQRGI